VSERGGTPRTPFAQAKVNEGVTRALGVDREKRRCDPWVLHEVARAGGRPKILRSGQLRIPCWELRWGHAFALRSPRIILARSCRTERFGPPLTRAGIPRSSPRARRAGVSPAPRRASSPGGANEIDTTLSSKYANESRSQVRILFAFRNHRRARTPVGSRRDACSPIARLCRLRHRRSNVGRMIQSDRSWNP